MGIWIKTDAGRQEMQQRALVQDRALRNLLLLIDGQKDETQLLATVPGVTVDSLNRLAELGLVQRLVERHHRAMAQVQEALAASAAPPAKAAPVPLLGYSDMSSMLAKLISHELGLRGFPLTLAVEKASNLDELVHVAERTIEQIVQRKGEQHALSVRRQLFAE